MGTNCATQSAAEGWVGKSIFKIHIRNSHPFWSLVHIVQRTIKCALVTVYSLQSTVYRVQCIVYKTQCSMDHVMWWIYGGNSCRLKLFTVKRTVQCTMHSAVHYKQYSALCTVQCTMNSAVHYARCVATKVKKGQSATGEGESVGKECYHKFSKVLLTE